MRDNVLQLAREDLIKASVQQLLSENKYSHKYIIGQVAEKFFLSASTVERIHWGEYDTRRRRDARKKLLAPPKPPKAPKPPKPPKEPTISKRRGRPSNAERAAAIAAAVAARDNLNGI
jgi:hypothetical protein